MATLSTRSLSQIVQSWTAAAQAACAQALDFSVGSVNLALAEAAGSIGLWLQKIALQALAQTRFATSMGTDADSWGAQFGFTRLPAIAATGIVTFSNTSALVATLPVGTQVETADGTQIFSVTADTGNLAYSATLNGYSVPANSSVSAPVQAVTAGTAGNAKALTVTLLVTTVPGISSTVSNAAGFLNGVNAESDGDYKARFPNFLAGLARANRAAIEAAIEGVQQGLSYTIIENQNAVGSALPYVDIVDFFDKPDGFFYPTLVPWPGLVLVIVDDGSGVPSRELLDRIAQAIEDVRGLGVQYQVIGPAILYADVTLSIAVSPGYDHSTVAGLAVVAIQDWLDSRPLGTTLIPLTRIPQIVYDGVAGVTNVTGVTINGQARDLTLNQVQVVKAGDAIVVN